MKGPQLDFYAAFLFLATETKLTWFQRLQNKTMRAIFEWGRDTSSVRMRMVLQWKSIKQKVTMTMIFINNLIKERPPSYLAQIIVRRVDINYYPTREASAPRVPNYMIAGTINS